MPKKACLCTLKNRFINFLLKLTIIPKLNTIENIVMKNKIGLVTFHDTANHGAALQAYATLHTLERLGYQSEIIDYTNEFRGSLYNLTNKIKYEIVNKNYKELVKTILAAPLIKIRMSRFDTFYSQFTPRSTVRYSPKVNLDNIEKEYKGVIVGSDQVWSTTNNGNDGFYYLNFINNKKNTISYASSFGSTRSDDPKLKPFIEPLSKICMVSIREKTGKCIFDNLTNRSAEVVLDPVFLLTKDEWIEIIKTKYSNEISIEEPFIDYTSNKEFLNKFFKIKGTEKYKLNCHKFGTSLNIKDFLDSKIKLKFTCEPRDFLYSIYNSNLLFTSSFHGVVLSIIFQKKFIVILSGNEGRDSRIVDLLDTLGLSNRIFCSSMSISDIDADINYKPIHKTLTNLRTESLLFLENSLKELD